MAERKVGRPGYTAEQKNLALTQMAQGGRMLDISKIVGVPVSNLYRWRAEEKANARKAATQRKVPKSKHITSGSILKPDAPQPAPPRGAQNADVEDVKLALTVSEAAVLANWLTKNVKKVADARERGVFAMVTLKLLTHGLQSV